MTRRTRTILALLAGLAVAALISACGTERIDLSKSSPRYKADTAAANLFNQRCGGCHTLAAAGTQGSGQDPRLYLDISGPNFDQRCERPRERVLYAIENGGFSGAYMPQNVVTGKQAREVATFVAQYWSSDEPAEPGVAACNKRPLGPLPKLGTAATAPGTSSSSSSKKSSGSSTGSKKSSSSSSSKKS